MNSLSSDSLQEAEWVRIRPVLDEAILRLSERDREAVLLRFFEGLGFAEIGARLLLTDKGAHKRVERALDKLRERLERRGITSSAAALSMILSSQSGLAAPVGLVGVVTGVALASNGPAASVVSLIELMSTTKTAIGLTATALLLTMGSATLEFREKHLAETRLASTGQTYKALSERLQLLKHLAQAADQNRAELERKLAALGAARAVVPNAAESSKRDTSKQNAVDPAEIGKAFLESHPEVGAALMARSRARAVARYGALFAGLGLGPEQITQFQNIIMQGEKITSDSIVYQVGPTSASRDEMNSQLQELLGNVGYSQYRQYMQTMPIHQANTELASALYYTNTPLSANQAAQLEQVFSAAKASGLSDSDSWAASLTQAPTILSAQQLAALVDIAKANGFEQQLTIATIQAQAPGNLPR